MPNKEVNINIASLARVEGEGALDLRIADGRIEQLNLRIYEPPRFFEKFLEGRALHEVPDLVARICGICPVAYQMSAVQALEAILGVEVTPWIRAMRRVMYCGEWIQSHSLHIHLLALPDFLGCNDVIEIGSRHPEVVQRGMRLQALGNRLISLFGGRSVHPVGVVVGGFSRAPTPAEVASIMPEIATAEADAAALLDWLPTLELPASDQAFVSVAMRDGDAYPLEQGRICSTAGLDIGPGEFLEHFQEFQVPHSNALHCLHHGAPYLVGPLARLNLNHDRLPATLRGRLADLGLGLPGRNLFHSVLARAVEIAYAVGEARRLLSDYHPPERPHVAFEPRAGVGFGCTEAPRGLLWHRYEVDDQGRILSANIIPPTSQNQARIEADLRASLMVFGLERDVGEIRRHSEQVIRNYDPCISCATHFLRLRLEDPAGATREVPPLLADRAGASIAVIGVGSPFGADRIGIAVASEVGRGLRERGGTAVASFSMGALDGRLLREVQPYDQVILIDAVQVGLGRGAVRVLDPAAIPGTSTGLSSHGLGLAEFVALLGAAVPAPVVHIIGIEIGPEPAPVFTAQEAAALTAEVIDRLRWPSGG